jgi:uncharacterized membrane protein
MKVRSLVVVGGILVVAMLAMSAWAWPQIPDDARVPIHWGPSGEPDGYGPKWVGLLGVPLAAAGVLALLAVIPRIEPRRRNLERSGVAYVAIGIAVMAFLAGLHAVAVLAALGNDPDVATLAMVGAAAMFIVIGNFLGKTRSNWFFGIRTPWTLSSDLSWARTHRAGGLVFVGSGAVVLLSVVVAGAEAAIWVMLVTLGVGVIGLVVYSYLVWRDDPARHNVEVHR